MRKKKGSCLNKNKNTKSRKSIDKRGIIEYNSVCEFCKGRSQVRGEVLKLAEEAPLLRV